MNKSSLAPAFVEMEPDDPANHHQIHEGSETSQSIMNQRAANESLSSSEYHDHSKIPIEDLSDPSAFINAAASAKEPPFPVKLHQILCNPAFRDVIAWLPHGRSWCVMKPKAFEEIVIPRHFRHCRYSSFMRQVNGWGFQRANHAGVSSYYHELFLRGLPQLCLKMRRPTGKQTKHNAPQTTKSPPPNFYEISKKNPLPDEIDSQHTHGTSARLGLMADEKGSALAQDNDREQKATIIGQKSIQKPNDEIHCKQASDQAQQRPLHLLSDSSLSSNVLVAPLDKVIYIGQPYIDSHAQLQPNPFSGGINSMVLSQQRTSAFASGGAASGTNYSEVDELRNALAASQLQNQLLVAALAGNASILPRTSATSSELIQLPSRDSDLTNMVSRITGRRPMNNQRYIQDQRPFF